jgi:hypothetical protein
LIKKKKEEESDDEKRKKKLGHFDLTGFGKKNRQK